MQRDRAGRRKAQLGMTLIEIVIVMGVLALVVGMVVVGFGATRGAEVARSVNQVANVIRYGYDKARVTGEHYRLLIDIDERSFSLQQGDARMYLPATDKDGKVVGIDESKLEAQAERDQAAAEAFNRSVQAEVYTQDTGGGGGGSYDPYKPQARQVPRRRPPMFDSFEEENVLTGLKDAFALPEGVVITYVRTDADLKPMSEGQTSIYFFPRGRTQQAHILIEDEATDSKYTIKLAPLTGRVTIEEGHEELKLPDDPTEAEDDLGKEQQRRSF